MVILTLQGLTSWTSQCLTTFSMVKGLKLRPEQSQRGNFTKNVLIELPFYLSCKKNTWEKQESSERFCRCLVLVQVSFLPGSVLYCNSFLGVQTVILFKEMFGESAKYCCCLSSLVVYKCIGKRLSAFLIGWSGFKMTLMMTCVQKELGSSFNILLLLTSTCIQNFGYFKSYYCSSGVHLANHLIR